MWKEEEVEAWVYSVRGVCRKEGEKKKEKWRGLYTQRYRWCEGEKVTKISEFWAYSHLMH